MLQIIGWLGCAYLVVKAFEMMGNRSLRNADGTHSDPAMLAIVLAFLSAALFAFLIWTQGKAFSPTSAASSVEDTPFDRCLNKATTATEISACTDQP